MKKTRNKDRGGKGEIKWARQGMVRASERQKKNNKRRGYREANNNRNWEG